MHRFLVVAVSLVGAWIFRFVDAAFSAAPTIKLTPALFDMTFDFIASAAVTLIVVDWVVSRRNLGKSHEIARAGWGFFVAVLLTVIVVRYVVPKLEVPDLFKSQAILLCISNALACLLLVHSTYLDEKKTAG